MNDELDLNELDGDELEEPIQKGTLFHIRVTDDFKYEFEASGELEDLICLVMTGMLGILAEYEIPASVLRQALAAYFGEDLPDRTGKPSIWAA